MKVSRIHLIRLVCFVSIVVLIGRTEVYGATLCAGEIGAPRSYSRTAFYVKNAQARTPEVFTLKSAGPLIFTVERTSTVLSGRAEVIVRKAEREGGTLHEVCDTGWVDPSKRPTFGTGSGGEPESFWTIEVYDEISGGPTGELPYVIHFLLSAPAQDGSQGSRRLHGSFPSDIPFGDQARSTKPTTCGYSSGPIRTGSTLDMATTDEFADLGEDLPQTYFVQAGRYVYVRVSSQNDVIIHVTVAAKEAGNSEFAAICSISTTTSGLKIRGMIYGQATWDRLLNPLWRVEISSTTGNGKALQNNIKVEIRRQHDPERMADKRVVSSEFPDFLPSCYVCRTVRRASRRTAGDPSTDIALQTRTAPSISLTSVSITVPTDFTAGQNSILEHTLEMGVAIWAAECSRCTIDTFSVLRVGDRRLVRTDLYQAAQIWPAPMSTLLADKAIGNFRVIISEGPKYVPVSDDDPTIRKLCQAREVDLPDYFRRVTVAFGCRSGSQTQMATLLHLILNVPRHATACGSSTNIIACEPDRELLELNGKDYSFGITGNDTLIGTGPRRVNLLHVILHEVGHWLWMGHVLSEGSIMFAALTASRCINDSDLTELQGAVQRREEDRSSTAVPQALLAHVRK
jgi:hypothetical protein